MIDEETGRPLAPPKLYNETQTADIVAKAIQIAPKDHTATAPTSTLCKVLTWYENGTIQSAQEEYAPIVLHQADYLASLLHSKRRVTDYNNALKLGYDPGAEEYPDWLVKLPFAGLLPLDVYAPGSPVAPVTTAAARKTGLPPTCMVCAGTTDSIAAFLAAGVRDPGEAVTSLGSTIAIKLLSETRVDNARYGVYSHRLGDAWLVGGASNTGGAVLRTFFTDEEMLELTKKVKPEQRTSLEYVPLLKPGERFPINDVALQPKLTPRPDDDAMFFQGLLESITDVEARGYALLAEMGASPLRRVCTAGGGSRNEAWSIMRANALGAPVEALKYGEAAYGAALLAKQGFEAVHNHQVT